VSGNLPFIKKFPQKSRYLPSFIYYKTKLRIAVNTRLLIKNKLEGIGWFTFESLKRMVSAHPEHEFFFIFDRDYSNEFIFSSNVTPVVIGPPARHPVLFYIWFEFSIPAALKKIKADLFISPDAYLSLKTNVPTLLVIHDLNFEHYPEMVPFLARKHYQYFTPKFAKKADRIATVSNFSKEDIVKQYHIDPEKIDVVFNGANEKFLPVNEETKKKTKEQFCGGNEYFIFIGALNPRKNLVNLFKALDIFKTQKTSNTKLLVVGEKMWWNKEIKSTFEKMKFQDDVVFTGRLSPEILKNVIGSSIALTYVSFFEGFGIPIVEAFRMEIPVITSSVTSMPEIAGDAAILVDPFNPQQIADAMLRIDSDKILREKLIQKGKQRSHLYSWDKTADNLWKSVEKIIIERKLN
jgi:glycosyltransferase involved in cell wall biosynthesis